MRIMTQGSELNHCCRHARSRKRGLRAFDHLSELLADLNAED
jgi:hypothetical protein